MTTYAAVSRAAGVVNHAFGSFTSDNTAALLALGFVPKKVKFVNVTDVVVWEKFEGMAANASIKTVTAGTTTIDTTGAITINSDGTVTLAAAAVGNAKAIAWEAYA
jgi:hypothetical protein